jgi:ATP-dependent DNA helicase RecG
VKCPDSELIKTKDSVTPEVTPEVKKILLVMDGELRRQDIQARLSLTDEKHFRENYQQPAVAMGLIEMTIPDRPTSSKQRYRLTDKGRNTKQLLHGD